jgi:CrcB protein
MAPHEHDPASKHARDPHPRLPVDPDVAPEDVPFLPHRVGRLLLERRRVLGAIALGGALGALARWAVGLALPHDPTAFPWSTFLVNAVGCLAIGVVLVLVVERWSHRPLARPFLGTGILGGFTTFSTYAVDARGLLAGGETALALAYLLGSVLVGLVAVVVGIRVTERMVR